jgi:predicted DNA-binding transcriptional regulator YafY
VADAAADAIERVVRLAYYLSRRDTFTMSQATLDVPGYGPVDRDSQDRVDVSSRSGEALRKKFGRDLAAIAEQFGVQTEFDTEDNVYRVRPPYFTPRERRALLSAMALVEVAGIDDDTDTLERLGRAVDETGRRVVVTVHEHVVALRRAIAARHPVTFRYHATDRVLEPWLIGQWRNHWYVIGRERASGERRVFRLDRIERGDGPPIRELAHDHYTIPDDVTPRDELRLDPNDWGRDPPLTVTIDVHPDHADRLRSELGGAVISTDGAKRSSDDQWIRISLLVRDYESTRDRVLRMGTHVRVHAPDEFVEQVRGSLLAIAGER